MRIKIHRGAKEIGGSCVELESGGASILLDLGLPLDAADPHPSLLPQIDGLADGINSNLLGIVLSHTHGDHYGLTGFAHASIPTFMGIGAELLLRAASPFMRPNLFPANIKTYADKTSFNLGPFKITPYLTDHSAYDAYSLLIEANGKRVFYSGDIRSHGRKGHLVEKLIQHPPMGIDALILEGTTLSRLIDVNESQQTEEQLEDEMLEKFNKSQGLVLTVFSPQNIDRFVTIYKAAKRAGRNFIADAYLAHVIYSLNLESLPHPKRNGFRVYLPASQRQRIIRNKSFDLLAPFKKLRIYKEDIAASPNQWVLLFRSSMAKELSSLCAHNGTTLIYSMWDGYLSRPGNDIMSWCESNHVEFFNCHTSGHADPATLIRFANALKPRRIIPIHTVVPQAYTQLFQNTVLLVNGEWLLLE